MRYTGFAILLLNCSCVFLRQATVPMPAVAHPAAAPGAQDLIVLLPGLGDTPANYESNGVVAGIQLANPGFDVIAADAHFGYYRSRTFVERLKQDVLDPVADRYRHIWLLGISLGGFGSTIYALEHPDEIDGLILLAPYMGDSDVIASVKAAGGLASWVPPDLDEIGADDSRKFYEMWSWLRGYATNPASMPELYLGYGHDDNLEVPNGLLAAVLPGDRVVTAPGGHDWTVWKPLIEQLLVRALDP